LGAALPLIAEQGLTLIGVALSGLENDDAVQLALPLEGYAPPALDAALDAMRDRFGSKAITRAALLGQDDGPTVPLLPD
jgi:DNA polymerase IV